MKLLNEKLYYYAMLDICVEHNGIDPEQVIEDHPKINFDNMTQVQFKQFLEDHY